jgi:membrane protease YdiL (CAAX protease family)
MRLTTFARNHPATAYFLLTFLLSWLGAFLLVAPDLLQRKPIPTLDGILMFPVMLAGPPVAALIITSVTGGRAARKDLGRRMLRWRVSVKWIVLPVFLFPSLILVTLLLLRHFVSPAFAPNFFPIGFLFGIPAGLLEEIGWTGFAFPALRATRGFLRSSLLLGVLWALWHLPVIDFLGAARPHGAYLPLFFLSFAAVLVAVRLLIAWLYTKTGSIPLAQCTHALSTGCLVTFGAAGVTPGGEALWYGTYALLLWIAVRIILHRTAARDISHGSS